LQGWKMPPTGIASRLLETTISVEPSRMTRTQCPSSTRGSGATRRFQGALARRGHHRLPVPHLIVAATAESAGIVVLHYDEHFERIAAVTNQPTEWVLPRGTV
jgi:predicted nucleic acid-binding protein